MPYFNLPALLVRNIIQLLRSGKSQKLSSAIKPRMISIFRKISHLKLSARCPIFMKLISAALPWSRLQYYVNTDQLIVRLWKG